MAKKISIIVPVYNSHDMLDSLLLAIDKVKLQQNWDLELLLIDDASKDNSFEKIATLSQNYTYIKGIKLSRNFGQQAALRTGLKFCTGDYIAIIDDDLQDPPEILAQFFNLLDEGYDVVYGIRRQRKENIFFKFSYSLFYKLLKKLSDTEIPRDSGEFGAMNRKVVDKMLLLNEKNLYLPGVRAWVGFKQTGLQYERQKRLDGKSGYTFWTLLKAALDGIFSFSVIPIRLITLIGTIGFLLAFFYGSYVLLVYMFVGIKVEGFTSLALLLVFFSSLILVSLGILGEYISRIYIEIKGRPHAIVSDFVNFTTLPTDTNL